MNDGGGCGVGADVDAQCAEWSCKGDGIAPSLVDDGLMMSVSDVERGLPPDAELGHFVWRDAPASGLRPTVRFAVAIALTLAWVAFSIWVSEPWRGELEAAIGPVMGWVIPIFLAYIPGLVIWFMIFTLLITRYEQLPLEPPAGSGMRASGRRCRSWWRPGTRVRRSSAHSNTSRSLTYPGRVEVDRRRQQLD